MDKDDIVKTCQCGKRLVPFRDKLISDAWNKGGVDYFEYSCTCGNKGVVEIECE